MKEPGLQIKNINTSMRITGGIPENSVSASSQKLLDPILNTFVETLFRPNLDEHLQKFFMQQIDKITSGCPDPNARLYFDYLSHHPERLDKLPSMNIDNEHIGLDLIRDKDSGQNQDDQKNLSSMELFLQPSQQSFSGTHPLYHHYLEIFPPSVSSRTNITPIYSSVATPVISSPTSSPHGAKRKKWFSFVGVFRRDSKQETSIGTSLRTSLKEIYIKEAKIERLLYREPDYPSLSLETNYLHLTIVDHAHQKKSEQKLLYGETSRDFNSTHERRFHSDRDIQIEDLFTPREGETVIPHRLLLIGPAGSGKSIFCRYALYRWAQGKLWQRDYRLVVWIPLRVLTTPLDLYPTSIGELIKQLYALSLSVAEIEKELRHYTQEKSLLYVLDGLDEVAYLLAQQSFAQRLLEMLLMQPDILITTRPHQVRGLVGNLHRMVENLGFVDEHIEKYVQQFFLSLEQLEQAVPCLQWLKSNPYLWGTAHVPINAELLCSLWEHAQRSKHHLASTSLTMTEVYAHIIEMLLDRQRSKEEAKQSILKLKSWKPYQLYEYYQQELNLLKVLGLYGLEEHRIVLEASKLNTFIEGSQLSLPVRGSLEELVLKPVDPSLQPQDQDVYFIHLTFQEFFAAQFIARVLSMKSSPGINRAVLTFISRYRYHPQYQTAWRFVAGLLQQLDDKQLGKTRHLEYFLGQLVQRPRDRIGLYDALLLLQCLEEGKLAIASNVLAIYIIDFFEWLRVYVDTFIQTQCNYLSELTPLESLYLPFLPALTRTLVGCPRLTSHPHFRAALKNVSENTHSLMKQLVLHLLQEIKIRDEEDLLLAVTLYMTLENITELPCLKDESSIVRYLLGRINYVRNEKLTTSIKMIDQILLSIHPKYESFTRTLIDFLNHQRFPFQEEIIRIICMIRPASEEVREKLAKIAKLNNKMLVQAVTEALQITANDQEKHPLSSDAPLQKNNFTVLEQLKTKFPQLNKENLMTLARQVTKKTYTDILVVQWIDWQLTQNPQQIFTMVQYEISHLKVEEVKQLIKISEIICSELNSKKKRNLFLVTLSIYHQQAFEYVWGSKYHRDKFNAFFLDQIGLKENILSSKKFSILKDALSEADCQPFEGARKKNDYSTEVRLVVLGGGGCGKSALTTRFITGDFIGKYDPTIEDSYRKLIDVDGHICMLDVMDTAGAEEYGALRDQFIKIGQVFILCYSITYTPSFEAAVRLRNQILKVKEGQDVPIILVGCQHDREDQRAISTEQGRALAAKFYMPFFECSAKKNINVTEIFHEAVRNHWGYSGHLRTYYQADFYPLFLETILFSALQKTLKVEALKNKESWVRRITDTWLTTNKPMEFIFNLLSQYSQAELAFAISVFKQIVNNLDYNLLNGWLSMQLANPRKIEVFLMNELISFFTIENLPESTLAMLFELVWRDGNFQICHQIFTEALSSTVISFYQVYAVRFFIVIGQAESYKKELIDIIIRGLINQGGNIRFAILQLLNQWCPPDSDLIRTLATLNVDKNLECRRMSMKLLAGLVNTESNTQTFQILMSCLNPTSVHMTEYSKEMSSWYEDNRTVIDALGTIEIKTLIIGIQHLPAEQLTQYAPYLRLILWSKQIAFVLRENHLYFLDENHQEVTLPIKEFDQVLSILHPDNKNHNPAECLAKRKGKEEDLTSEEVNNNSSDEQLDSFQADVLDSQAYSTAQLLSQSLPFIASSSSVSSSSSSVVIDTSDQAAVQINQQMLMAEAQIRR